MRSDPMYRAAVGDLAAQTQSSSLPSFEIENQAAAIASEFGVGDADVRSDVAEAERRLVELGLD